MPLIYQYKFSICSLTCSYNFAFIKMVASGKLMTSWKYNVIYVINFSTHFNFPMCYYDFENRLFYVCINLVLIWENFRIFAILPRQKCRTVKNLGSIHYLLFIFNTLLKFEVLSYFFKFPWKLMTSSKSHVA